MADDPVIDEQKTFTTKGGQTATSRERNFADDAEERSAPSSSSSTSKSSRFSGIKARISAAGASLKEEASATGKGLGKRLVDEVGPRKKLESKDIKTRTADIEAQTKLVRAQANLRKAKGDRLGKITNMLAPTGSNRTAIPFGNNPNALYGLGGLGGGRGFGGGNKRGRGGGMGRMPNPNDLYGLNSMGGGRGRRGGMDMGGVDMLGSMGPPEDFFGMSSFGGGGRQTAQPQRRRRGRPRKNQQAQSFGPDPMRDFYGL